MTPGAGTEGQPRFDPRHDPRFQRGFRPGEHAGAEHTGAEHSRAEHSRAHHRSRAETSAQPDAATPVASSPPAASTPPATSTPRTPAPSPANREFVRVPAPDARTNSQLGEGDRIRNGEVGHDDGARDENGWATDASPRRNPFLTLLWVIGVALIGGGLWLAWRTVTEQNTSYDADEIPFDMILRQLSWTLVPTMISTGFLVIVGLIFERAIRWQRQRERRATS